MNMSMENTHTNNVILVGEEAEKDGRMVGNKGVRLHHCKFDSCKCWPFAYLSVSSFGM
jgi:hypothetical protein